MGMGYRRPANYSAEDKRSRYHGIRLFEQREGFLRLTESEAVRAGASFPKTARVLLEYGAQKEGYWKSDRFMANIKDAVAIAEFKYPPEKNTLVLIFDQSSCHKAHAENALNTRMNVHPGGKQPCM